ncbi:MAG TPA: molybdenum cofactor guanylyltransferase [Pyrinomonadaceae bacterium]|nr:molybdenum cofactor guanylyltransferase [Pyrinomonadaceae bacterium]
MSPEPLRLLGLIPVGHVNVRPQRVRRFGRLLMKLSPAADNMSVIEGFILTGGASSRMGESKAHLRLGGQTFVARAREALAAIASQVSVVSSHVGDEAFGLAVVPDIYEGAGALGGLHAALTAARADWIAIVSCDLPFVSGELFVRLAAFVRADADAVAPVQEDGRLQPLCALYRREPCLATAEALLRAGELRPRALLGRLRTRLVKFAELSDLAGAPLFFRNVNTPEDYAAAARELAALKTEG